MSQYFTWLSQGVKGEKGRFGNINVFICIHGLLTYTVLTYTVLTYIYFDAAY